MAGPIVFDPDKHRRETALPNLIEKFEISVMHAMESRMLDIDFLPPINWIYRSICHRAFSVPIARCCVSIQNKYIDTDE